MVKSNISRNRFWLYRGIILGCAAIVFFLLSFSLFNIIRQLELDRLHAVAEISNGIVDEQLRRDDSEAAEQALTSFARKHSVDALELYSSDGSIVTAYGIKGGPLPESFVAGEDFSYSWPFGFTFQYSRIILQGDKPLGFLILYSVIDEQIALWGACGAVSVILLLFLFTSLLFSGRSIHFHAAGRGSVLEASLSSSNSDLFINEKGSSEAPFPIEVFNSREEIERLRRERDKAVAFTRAKGDFLANMSHEIRTAMNGVIGILSLLQKSGMQKEHSRLLDTASRSADSLLLIINDILDFSKIEAGKISFENVEFDLRELAEECVDLFIDTARAKKISLHCYIPVDISTLVIGDPTRLRQIITNLLSNAVKFTEEGEVNLGVTLVQTNDRRQQLLFSIEDTGIGIASEKLDGIFDMFNQAESSTARMYGGTGLGLNICKQLVELQHGEVGVNSRLGQGTSFWFTLDFSMAGSAGDEEGGAARAVEENIALFGSCETCSTIVGQYLKDSRVKSRLSGSTNDVIEQLRDMADDGYIPDTMIVDISDGSIVIDELGKTIFDLFPEKKPKLFVISRGNSIESQFMEKGVCGIIYKPIRLRQLHEELFRRESMAAGGAAIKNTETLKGCVLLVDDEQVNQHVGQIILKKLGLKVDIASSGQAAVEKTAAKLYDLVLIDVQMPGMSGIEATEIIRRREVQENRRRQTIIAVTANALSSIKEKCLACGMDDFIPKPIKPDQLFQALQPWLENGDRPGNNIPLADSFADSATTSAVDPVVWNKQLALEYLGGDEKLLLDLMKLFLERRPILLAAIEDALASTDGEAVCSAAHAFKGAVNHFAAQQCQQIAQRLEHRTEKGWDEGAKSLCDELRAASEVLERELKMQVAV